MSGIPENNAVETEQRYAEIRVFGDTLFAFLALLTVALLVRPDLMQVATAAIMTTMPGLCAAILSRRMNRHAGRKLRKR